LSEAVWKIRSAGAGRLRNPGPRETTADAKGEAGGWGVRPVLGVRLV
jgi:hypothetical protein